MKFEAILKVSEALDSRVLPLKYERKLAKNMTQLINESDPAELTLQDQVKNDSLGNRCMRDLPVPNHTFWSFSNESQPEYHLQSGKIHEQVPSLTLDDKADLHKMLFKRV